MQAPVICLACGGVVDEGDGIPDGAVACCCPPPGIEAHAVKCPECGGSLRVGARACPFCRSTLATRRCDRCFAWNLAAAEHCQGCGATLLDPSRQPGKPSSLACPRCGGSLSARCYGDLHVDECDACGGLLVSPRMMDRIVSSRDGATNLRLALPARPAVRETAVRYVRCPVCRKLMNRQAFGRISGVVVDVCRDNGVWFDPGELGAVLAFVQRGGLTRAREREQRDLADATRALRAERAAASTGSLTQTATMGLHGEPGGGARLTSEFLGAILDIWR